MNRIFISYRSSDGRKDASQLALDLVRLFGDKQVFFDKHDLRGGSSWRGEIMNALDGRPIVLPILTPDFFGAKTDAGQCRIDEPDDPVRQELEAALQARATVIPLLTENVLMPKAALLPASLRPITERHALKLRTGDWVHDLARLASDIEALGVKRVDTEQQDGQPATAKRKPWAGTLLAVFVLLVLLEIATAGPDADAQTFLGAAFVALIPVFMAWLARRWTQHETSRWPRWGATAMVVLAVLEVLVFLGRGTPSGTQPPVAQAPAHEGQSAGDAPQAPSSSQLLNAPATLLADNTADPLDTLEPPAAQASALTGTWLAIMADGSTLPFTVRQQGAQITMSSSRLVIATDPYAQRMASWMLTQQDGQIKDLRFRADGSMDGQMLELTMTLESGNGERLIDEGSMSLLLSEDRRSMSGGVHFSKDQPSVIAFQRR